MKSDLKKLDSSTLETSKNYLIRNFLRNGRVRFKLRLLILSRIRKKDGHLMKNSISFKTPSILILTYEKFCITICFKDLKNFIFACIFKLSI